MIEITYNGETSSVQLAPNASEDSWSLLEKLFRERFGIKDDEGAPKARYIDQEGDVVTLDAKALTKEFLEQTPAILRSIRCKLYGCSLSVECNFNQVVSLH